MTALLGRAIDGGAVFAGWVGVAMAMVIVVSFILVIPVGDAAVGLLSLPAGLVIGYYANARSERAGGPWPRLVGNAVWAGLLTGLTMAGLLLAVKALFFFADAGYRDASAGGPIDCAGGADCVYRRYVEAGRGPDLAQRGVTDEASFAAFYWREQASTAGTILAITLVGGVLGGLAFGVSNRRPEIAPGT